MPDETFVIEGGAIEGSEVSLTDGLTSEELPSLADFAEEPGGALPRGWYKATVIEGYAVRSGKQFLTEDAVSNKGDSRNLRLCFSVTPLKGDPRNMQDSINYRTTDFDPQRIAFIKEMREEYKGVRGKWSDSDAQRSSLAIASLGGLEKALGVRFKRNEDGSLSTAGIIGQDVEIRLNIDDRGYNSVTAYAKLGTFTAKPRASKG